MNWNIPMSGKRAVHFHRNDVTEPKIFCKLQPLTKSILANIVISWKGNSENSFKFNNYYDKNLTLQSYPLMTIIWSNSKKRNVKGTTTFFELFDKSPD